MKVVILLIFSLISNFALAHSIETLPKAPIAGRMGHSAISIGTKAIFWGGFNGGSPMGPAILLNDGATYDIESKQWSLISPLNAPTARTGHYAKVIAGKMYIVGGCNKWIGPRCETLTKSGAAYDVEGDNWSKIADSPIEFQQDPNFNPPGVLEDRYLIFFSKVTAIYDSKTNQWSLVQVPNFLGENYFPNNLKKVFVGSRVIALLNNHDSSPIKIGSYSFQESKWTELPSYSDFNTCSDQSMIYSLNKLYIFGRNCSKANGVKETSIFDLEKNAWSSGAQTPFDTSDDYGLNLSASNGIVFLYDPVTLKYQHNHEIFTFDEISNSWTKIGVSLSPQNKKLMEFSSGLTALKNSLVIWGGREENVLPFYSGEGAIATFSK